MPSLKEVKNRINSVKSTQQITRAMKMVAAAKLRRAQDRISQLRPYAAKLSEILQNISASMESASENPFAIERDVKSVLIVPITSDRGLCGAFNTNVAKKMMALRTEINAKYPAAKIHHMPIGSKGSDYLKRREMDRHTNFEDAFQNLDFETAKNAAEYAMDGFLNGTYDLVYLVYNSFVNVATQSLEAEQFLPIVPKANAETSTTNVDYIYEPNKEGIVKELIPKTLKTQFYKALLDSNASEHGARMTAMDKATDNAGELLKELKLTYNRTRQAAITKEILEIVGGAEALSQS
jgi:F-type H+-transporting ATPase subunit gamma